MPREITSIAALGALCYLLTSPAAGQEGPIPSPVEPPLLQVNAEAELDRSDDVRIALNQQAIEAQIKRVEESPTLDDGAKATQADAYRKVLAELEAADRYKAETARLVGVIESAPTRLADVKRELADLQAASPATDGLIVGDLSELEQQLLQQEADLAELQKKKAEQEVSATRRAERRIELPKKIAELKQKLEESKAQLAAAPPADADLAMANRAWLLARQKAWKQEVEAYEKELQSYDATAEVAPLSRDLTNRKLALAEKHVKRLRQVVDQRRAAEASRQQLSAQRNVQTVAEELRPLAEQNAEFARQRTEVSAQIEALNVHIEEDTARLKTLRDEFERARERLNRAGINAAIGSLLQKQRSKLPNLRRYRVSLRDRAALLGDIQLATYELQDAASKSPSVPPREDDSPAAREFNANREELIDNNRGLYDSLSRDYESYLRKTVELDTVQREIINEAEKFTSFIDEHVLWIPNAAPLGSGDVANAGEAFLWLTKPIRWQKLTANLIADAGLKPYWAGLGLLLVVAIAVGNRWLKRYVASIGQMPQRKLLDQFSLTLGVLAATLAIAMMYPAATAYLGWRVTASQETSRFAAALAAGLWQAAIVLATFEVIRQICRPGGLARVHFNGSPRCANLFRRHASWLAWFGVPLAFLVGVYGGQSNEAFDHAIGRTAFIGGMILLSFSFYRLFHPSRGALADLLAAHRDGWLNRTRYVWYAGTVMAPPALAALAWVGYFYTAMELAGRLWITMLVALALTVFYDLVLRYLIVAHRRLALDQARQRLEARQAETQSVAGAPEGGATITLPPQQVDLAAVGDQTRHLLRSFTLVLAAVALWANWVGVLPALRFLDGVVLWTTDAGSAVSLHAMLLTAAIVLLTIVAVKNVPGLLELTILKRLPLDAGEKYALATISRYVITVVGLFLAFDRIGIGWAKLQWLAAAVSLGLGFGLQEIFANFVSGLILLFERPIRVGDVVTIGDVTGIVSRIRMRATTIVDWDRKELVVPNKEFITGRLLNWTLSDTVTRLVVTVGVAYAEDPKKVGEILLEVLRDEPQVMDEPPPNVTFDQFADSSLNFTLRGFVAGLDRRLPTTNELHTEIHRRFREAGVEIAFPQRDLHIRTVAPTLAIATTESSANRAA